MKTLGTFFLLVALTALFACGGGGGNNFTPAPTPTPTPTPAPSNPVPTVAGFPFFGATTATNPGFITEIDGANFVQSSVVRWNGQDRPTTFISSSRLTFQVTDADVAQVALVPVLVFNPAPGGGLSDAVPFRVFPTLPPDVVSLAPQPVAGTGPATFTLSGGNFVGGSVVRWNGQDRPTSIDQRSGTLLVTLSAADLATAGIASLAVFNPQGGGLSRALAAIINPPQNVLPLATNHMIWDSTRQRIIASVAGPVTPRVVIVDPATANVVSSVAVAGEPDRLALSDDGSALWVGIGASGGAVASATRGLQKVDMATLTAGPLFSVGSDPINGAYLVDSLAVVPGQPDSVVVARYLPGFSPRHQGVAVFDNGTQRGVATQALTGATVIVFGTDPTTLYGFNNESDLGFRRLRVDATGVHELDNTFLTGAVGDQLKWQSGRVYFSSGGVVDPTTATPTLVGTFSLGVRGSNATGNEPSTAEHKAFFWVPSNASLAESKLEIFDTTTFAQLATVPMNMFSPRRNAETIRFGLDNLALRGDAQITFVHSTAVLPPPGFSIVTSHLPPTAGNKRYQYVLATDGGFEPINWSITNGTLPSGLAIGAGGFISGLTAPVTSDTLSSFIVSATDAIGTTTSAPLSILAKAGSLGSNDSCSSATPISSGMLLGSLSPHGDIDVYSFTGTQGATITIDTLGQQDPFGPLFGLNSEIDTVVELLDSSCNQIALNDDANIFTLGSQLTFTVPATGTYFIRVSDARGDGRPDFFYDLQLTGAK